MPKGKDGKEKARSKKQLAFMAASVQRGYVPLTRKQKAYFQRVLRNARRAG